MKTDITNIKKTLIWLLSISALVRFILAYWLEFGNDEVYYWTFAMYPDWSHFDHPPMLGWVIQLFSLNLLFDSELALRISSVIFMTVNTYLVFLIGKQIKNEQTGLYAAFLYTASIYAFVITGIFILPDTPQNLFWFLALLMFVKAFQNKQNQSFKWMILAGLFAGLSILSKYTGVFLWVGAGLYILFFDRRWLKSPALYLSVLLSLTCLLPVVYWNFDNNFVSFAFHGNRVGFVDAHLRFDLIGTELLGEFLYNNPINYILIIISLIAICKRKYFLDKHIQPLFLLIALPMIGIFWFVALFRSTLPHWVAPAFNTLIFVAAAFLNDKNLPENGKIKIPNFIKAGVFLLAIILIIGSLEIKTGFIPLPNNQPYHRLGKNDFTLDMYGWRKVKDDFAKIRNEKIAQGLMKETDGLVSENWFPLANIDYYVAHPLGVKAYGMGNIEKIHKYLWINEMRGGMQKGNDYWFLTNSRDYKNPNDVFKGMFTEIITADTIEITRCGKPAKRYFVFLLKDLKTKPYSLSDFEHLH